MATMLVTALLALAATLACAVASDDLIVKTIELGEELECYQCLDYQPHCLSLANTTAVQTAKCSPGEIFCKVERLHFQDSALTFERGCTSRCSAGCERAGDYLRCSSCCNQTLCNVDSSTITGLPVTPCLTLLLTFAALIETTIS